MNQNFLNRQHTRVKFLSKNSSANLIDFVLELELVERVGEPHDGLILHLDELEVGGSVLLHLVHLFLYTG